MFHLQVLDFLNLILVEITSNDINRKYQNELVENRGAPLELHEVELRVFGNTEEVMNDRNSASSEEKFDYSYNTYEAS